MSVICDDVLLRPDLDIDTLGLHVETTIRPAPLDGDPRLIERLVANLVDNAVGHNVIGGRWFRPPTDGRRLPVQHDRSSRPPIHRVFNLPATPRWTHPWLDSTDRSTSSLVSAPRPAWPSDWSPRINKKSRSVTERPLSGRCSCAPTTEERPGRRPFPRGPIPQAAPDGPKLQRGPFPPAPPPRRAASSPSCLRPSIRSFPICHGAPTMEGPPGPRRGCPVSSRVCQQTRSHVLMRFIVSPFRGWPIAVPTRAWLRLRQMEVSPGLRCPYPMSREPSCFRWPASTGWTAG